MLSSLFITQCLQNDFVKPIGKYEPLPNLLHVGYEESKRLLGEKPREGPLAFITRWAYEQNSTKLIHLRDWHDPNDPLQSSHLKQFGGHCIKDTQGAQFVFQDFVEDNKFIPVINSLSLNDFWGTNLGALLDPYKKEKIKIGLVGVWTEAKITFLAYELKTRYPDFQIAVCSALTASSSRTRHFMALDQLERLLGVRIYQSVGEFIHFLGGEIKDFSINTAGSFIYPILQMKNGLQLLENDEKLLKFLFRDSKEVKLQSLAGGFSGNMVLVSESIDLHGQSQAPHVIKIGPQKIIGQERTAFEQVESVLGNNAPHIADFLDYTGRGGIKYRYAAMGVGESTTFQKLYCAGMSFYKTKTILHSVFHEQLGQFYRAAIRERINLLEYYGFNNMQFASRIRQRIENLLGNPVNTQDVVFPDGKKGIDLCLFYEETLPSLIQLCEGTAYISYVHGDLNGANIVIDSNRNVWLIDFFHAHRGHVLKDLIKLENDILYIFTPISNEEEFKQALLFTDLFLFPQNISSTFPKLPKEITVPKLEMAYNVIKLIRSFYNGILHEDINPLQLWIGQLRYAVHTLSFDESSEWQKKWALYTASSCAEKITAFFQGKK